MSANIKAIVSSQNLSLRLGVLISGSGSNLQAIIEAIEDYQMPGVEIALVVSNKADAYGLQRALKHKLPAIYLPWRQRTVGAQSIAPKPSITVGAQFIAPNFITPESTMSESESQLTALLHLFQVDLVVLAG